MKFIVSIIAFIVPSVVIVPGCDAQDLRAFDLLRGFIGGAARLEEAKEAWSSLSAAERSCMTQALDGRNTDIPTLIGSGIMPGDRRLKGLLSRCRGGAETSLKRDFACDTAGENGNSVSTRCDQTFARDGADGHPVSISPKEADELRSAGTRVFVTNSETEEARQQRRETSLAQGRAEQLRAALGELDQYRSSSSPVVRSEVARLRGQIEQQLAALPGPAEQRTEALTREVGALKGLSNVEAQRSGALAQVAQLRFKAEAATKAATSQAFRARLLSLRQSFHALSGGEAAVQAERPIGPAFDCTKVKTSLPLLICGDTSLRVLDVETWRPFYTLVQLLPDNAAGLNKEADALGRRAVATCHVPSAAGAAVASARKLAPCIAATYRKQKQAWEARVEHVAPVAARQELKRSLAEHIRLQGYLRNAGDLPSDAVADGVYGSATRRAIVAFAATQGLAADGFMSDTIAEHLIERFSRSIAENRSGEGPLLVERLNALAADYNTYLADLASAERDQEARDAARVRLASSRNRIEKLIAAPIPAQLRSQLSALLQKTREPVSGDPADVSSDLETALEQLKPDLDEADQAAHLVTKANHFLFEGGADDLVLLYDSSASAVGVERGLDGKLVFDPTRTAICSTQSTVSDRIESEFVVAFLKTIGAPAGAEIPACKGDRPPGSDVIVLRRGELPEHLATLKRIASDIDAGSLSRLGIISAEAVQVARKAEAVKVAKIEADVMKGTSDELALLTLDNRSNTICRIIDGSSDLHARLLQPFEKELAGRFKAPPNLVRSDAESAFLSSKHGSCGAIYGNMRDLGNLSRALLRDKVSFRFLSIRITPETLAQAGRAVADADPGIAQSRDEAARAAIKRSPVAAASFWRLLAALRAPRPATTLGATAVREKRVALVIGNSRYQHSPTLGNPAIDAAAVATALSADGFDVVSRTDLTREQLLDALAAFSDTAENADWAVIYFAGHGIQMNSSTYLVPVDAKLATEKTARYEALPIDQITEAAGGARKLRLVIIDACRASPFVDHMRVSSSTRGTASRGLARPPELEPGTMIVYAAKDGEVASDGAEGAGSPFARALVNQLRKPGVEVHRMFDYVRDEVIDATGHHQYPYTYGSMPSVPDFFFKASP